MADPVALVALAVDATVGWPPVLYRRIGHPVGGFAAIITRCETAWNQPRFGFARRRIGGIATLALLLATAIGGAWIAARIVGALPAPWGWIGIGLLAAPGLALHSLYQHVRDVAVALEATDIEGARIAVGRIVGRDTAQLDEHGIARAAIESLAESFCDGVAAPFFWLVLGGLPGLWAYKAVNTADSMIGHREERWRAFGWAAARVDDIMNLVPARLCALLLCLLGGGGWRILWCDHARHASPNAGWPEAAMAGALGLSLAGPIAYDGEAHDKPWIGNGRRDATAHDIRRALRLYVLACCALFLLAALLPGITLPGGPTP
jgi:adenosylcobinamide-phosphate synthase